MGRYRGRHPGNVTPVGPRQKTGSCQKAEVYMNTYQAGLAVLTRGTHPMKASSHSGATDPFGAKEQAKGFALLGGMVGGTGAMFYGLIKHKPGWTLMGAGTAILSG